jgi:hypothetical protein
VLYRPEKRKNGFKLHTASLQQPLGDLIEIRDVRVKVIGL